MQLIFLVFIPKPLRAVRVLFHPWQAGGGGKKLVQVVSQMAQDGIYGKGHCLGCVGVQCHGVTLIDLLVVTLTFKILSGYISGTVRCRRSKLDREIGKGL